MRHFRILAALAATVLPIACGQEIPYRVAPAPWPEELGSQRAIVHVDAAQPAVLAEVPWRRHDANPERKAVLVCDPAGAPVPNTFAQHLDSESAGIVFEARQAGDYSIYYFPHATTEGRKPQFGEKGVYREPRETASPEWRRNISNSLPRASVVEFQSRTQFDSFYPMEVVATAAEMKQLAAGHSDPFLLFPEPRERSIRMSDALPYRWIRTGPSNRFDGVAWRGEFYVYQIGVYAQPGRAPAGTAFGVEFSDLAGDNGTRIPASAMMCLQTGGVDSHGNPLERTFKVEAGRVGALWCGVQVPSGAAPGNYSGSMILVPEGSPRMRVDLRIEVKRDTLRDGGVDQPERLARLQWLNSKAGLGDSITRPYTPLRVTGREVASLGRTVRFDEAGFPASVRAGGHEVLAAPIALRVYEGKRAASWKSASRVASSSPSKVVLASESHTDGFELGVRSTIEFDGSIGFDVTFRALRDANVSDIALEIPYARSAVPYSVGMGLKGGIRPHRWQWQWTDQPARWKEQGSNLEYFLWMGGVDAGLFCRLKSPLADWQNGRSGAIGFSEDGDVVRFRASSGPRAIAKGAELKFSFRLLPTPVKPLGPDHWATRYAHAFKSVDDLQGAGATVINVHHDTLPNLFINYPFLNLDLLVPYAAEAHARGMKLKVYYTVRELTTHLPELWAFRSLGSEIYRTTGTQGHGQAHLDYWLQEHLRTGYTPAWITRTPTGEVDAAIRVFFDSRLGNFYLEGLRWLLENVPIDGIYLDEIGYSRDMMQRVRRVLDARPGSMIDLHGNRDWWSCNSPIGYYMEHLPYVDRLWFGEAFDPDSPPEFWLIEMSGLPFGLSSDMLEQPNPWRGMLFGMTSRVLEPGTPLPSSLWKQWDAFGIGDATMVGWWDAAPLAKTGRDDVRATVYHKPGKALVALASWAASNADVRLEIDWKRLGIDPRRARITAPAIAGFQEARVFPAGDAIPVAPGKGWLLLIEQN